MYSLSEEASCTTLLHLGQTALLSSFYECKDTYLSQLSSLLARFYKRILRATPRVPHYIEVSWQ